jgi:hypothetical protein
MSTDWENPADSDEERPVVEYEDAKPEHLTDDVEVPEADALEQAIEVDLDDED